MKKTLVALAVLAASGASFAQTFTITGDFTYAFDASTKNGKDSAGMGIDSSELYIAATESIGADKVTVKMGLNGLDRSSESGSGPASAGYGAGVYGGDASISYATSAYTLTAATTRGGDYLSGGISGVAGLGLDGKIFNARTSNDWVQVDIPVGAWTIGLNMKEAAAGIGEGAGFAGDQSGTGQRTVSVSGTYAAGPLVGNLNYVVYDAKSTGAGADNVLRAAGSYDLGVVKVGAGYMHVTAIGGLTIKDSLLGVSMPVGAFTLRGQLANRNADAAIGTNTGFGVGSVSSSAVGVSYSLSKRTTLIANYKRWDVIGQATANTNTWIAIDHGF